MEASHVEMTTEPVNCAAEFGGSPCPDSVSKGLDGPTQPEED